MHGSYSMLRRIRDARTASSLREKRRLFFRIAFDGNRFNRPSTRTWPAMSEPPARRRQLQASRMVSQIFSSWNPLMNWMHSVDLRRRVA
jgi:hypothetical protein